MLPLITSLRLNLNAVSNSWAIETADSKTLENPSDSCFDCRLFYEWSFKSETYVVSHSGRSLFCCLLKMSHFITVVNISPVAETPYCRAWPEDGLSVIVIATMSSPVKSTCYARHSYRIPMPMYNLTSLVYRYIFWHSTKWGNAYTF